MQPDVKQIYSFLPEVDSFPTMSMWFIPFKL